MGNWIGSNKNRTVSLTHVPTGKQFTSWTEAIAYDNSLRG